MPDSGRPRPRSDLGGNVLNGAQPPLLRVSEGTSRCCFACLRSPLALSLSLSLALSLAHTHTHTLSLSLSLALSLAADASRV